MKAELLLWSNRVTSSPFLSLPLFSSPSYLLYNKTHKVISATLESSGQLTARERRQLRNERREEKTTNWKEEVEEKLLKKQKKKFANWKEELNLDNLAIDGPQWWAVRVSRLNGHETAEQLARYLARIFPNVEFKVYAPAVHVKRKLKNGTVSVKQKPLFPGCIFLRCVLNKELHDTIRECPGIGGFIGSKVGNTKRQINRPRPVSIVDIEAMFRQAKEEQEKADQAFAEDQQSEEILKNENIRLNPIKNVMDSVPDSKPKRRTTKASTPVTSGSSIGSDDKLLTLGSSIRVVSGSFSDFKGTLKKLDAKSGMATVVVTLFGKESIVDVDINQIVAEA
ncbi:hypothetical protein AQUCO_00900800v1 [Aquilegia coerulea]|uniref:NusG-like N-terminal domain-containing protein n=1 Tax=Aquilegia coerulea TaxID=218851 RepID=A0A2G5EFG3_AQUCA|nr:hypothetical protein AQUCO_00900800v1 [Aquilegia coerulea]PIA54496.1 hypothetical protein AQUCO_00900800v1 [Aquilegia coerulea]